MGLLLRTTDHREKRSELGNSLLFIQAFSFLSSTKSLHTYQLGLFYFFPRAKKEEEKRVSLVLPSTGLAREDLVVYS